MKKYKIEIKWALIFATMFLAWMLLEKLLGYHSTKLDQQQFITTLILIPSIIIYILALRDKRKNYYSGSITYKQSLISGVLLTFFIALLSPVNQLITSYIITPDYFSNAIKYAVSNGIFTQVQADQQFNIKNYLITSAVGGLVTGVIFATIVSLFIKTKNRQHEQYKKS